MSRVTRPFSERNEGQTAGDRGQVGQCDRPQAPGELGEDAAVELPAPSTVDRPERAPRHVVHDEIQVAVLGRHGAEPVDRQLLAVVDPLPAERVTHVVGADLGIGFGDRRVTDHDPAERSGVHRRRGDRDEPTHAVAHHHRLALDAGRARRPEHLVGSSAPGSTRRGGRCRRGRTGRPRPRGTRRRIERRRGSTSGRFAPPPWTNTNPRRPGSPQASAWIAAPSTSTQTSSTGTASTCAGTTRARCRAASMGTVTGRSDVDAMVRPYRRPTRNRQPVGPPRSTGLAVRSTGSRSIEVASPRYPGFATSTRSTTPSTSTATSAASPGSSPSRSAAPVRHARHQLGLRRHPE